MGQLLATLMVSKHKLSTIPIIKIITLVMAEKDMITNLMTLLTEIQLTLASIMI